MQARWFLGVVILYLVSTACRLFVPPAGRPATGFDAARYGSVEKDVAYCVMDGQPQKMDLYFPKNGGPWPVLLYVHGGGWQEGDKSEGDGWRGWTEQGYLVVALNYRMYPAFTFPAMIEDVKCAVRSLRAHAAMYNLDPERIAAAGSSAGGHLVALLGTADQSAGWDVGEYLDQSSRVQAVIVIAGPADLAGVYPDWVKQLIANVFPAGAADTGYVRSSPVAYITPDDPPFLILHGDRDDVVPVQQGQLLHERLLANGVVSQLVIITHGDHSLNGVDGPAIPAWDELALTLIGFLDERLKTK